MLRAMPVRGRRALVIAANRDVGVLYGAFHFLRLLQTQQPIDALSLASAPRIQHRMLNHWDNLDGTVERGYAGRSLWDWQTLPDYQDPALHGLRARQRLARHQRHGAHQRQRQRHEPHAPSTCERSRRSPTCSDRTASAST